MELAIYYPSLTLSTFGLRYLAGVKRAKKLIEDGQIGKIQSFEVSLHSGPADVLENLPYNWTCIRDLSAGPLFCTAVHLVDLMTYLCGQRVYTVCGTVKRFQNNPSQFKYDQHLTREDFVTWQGLLEGNIPCTTVINNNFPGKFKLRFSVTGATGALTLEDGNLYAEKPGQSNKTLESPLIDQDQSINQPILQMKSQFDYRHPQLVVAGVVSMCASLKEAFQPVTERRRWSPEQLVGAATFRDCQYARAVVEAVKKSSESRRWTEVRIPTKGLDGGSLTVSLSRLDAI
jgi:predicted dehydrogenase